MRNGDLLDNLSAPLLSQQLLSVKWGSGNGPQVKEFTFWYTSVESNVDVKGTKSKPKSCRRERNKNLPKKARKKQSVGRCTHRQKNTIFFYCFCTNFFLPSILKKVRTKRPMKKTVKLINFGNSISIFR